MDFQYVALQIYLHKDVNVEYAYAMAHEFLEYKTIYDAKKADEANYHKNMRSAKTTDSDLITEDVFLSKTDPFS